MNLGSLLPVEAVIPALHARDKKQVLKLLASYAAALCPLPEKEIFSALAEREQAGCTGMGNGVCIPHGRFGLLDSICIIFARLDKPIEFGAADGKKVDLVFLLLTPLSSDTEHIKTLATISRLLRDKELCKALRSAGNAEELHRLLTCDYNARPI